MDVDCRRERGLCTHVRGESVKDYESNDYEGIWSFVDFHVVTVLLITLYVLMNVLFFRLHEKVKHLEDLLTKSEGSIERLERDLVQATKVCLIHQIWLCLLLFYFDDLLQSVCFTLKILPHSNGR